MMFRLQRYIALICCGVLLALAPACDDSSSNKPETVPDVKSYEITFEATWSAATHPTDFPFGPHFSGLIGTTHKEGVHLWQTGELASPGIKNMAETGSKSPLGDEIDALIASGDACLKISGGGINPSPGTLTVTVTVTSDCAAVTIVSMIAPSPDWFVGVDGVTLFEDGDWVDQKVIELYPYDAGTDSGVTYNSRNAVTTPPEPIQRIEGDPFLNEGSVAPLGTFTFTRLDEQ
jgi:hypothetical protein